MPALAAIILAAGKGTRMRSSRPKVLHSIAGEVMLSYPIEAADQLECERIVCVLGQGRDQVQGFLKKKASEIKAGIKIAHQREQKGTADAVKTAETQLRGFSGDILILSGDVPFVSPRTLRAFRRFHQKGKHALSLMTAIFEGPDGYGRVLRNGRGDVLRIVEELDVTPDERRVKEINAGIYMTDKATLFSGLTAIKRNARKKEFYLTDLIERIEQEGGCVGGFCVEQPIEVMGINTQFELAVANRMVRARLIEEWMRKGVHFVDPTHVCIERSVRLAPDVSIGSACTLRGQTVIRKGATIDVGSLVVDSTIAAGVHIGPYCVLESSHVQSGARVGPFAHLRPGSKVGPGAKVGNFVEMKKASLGRGAKANHLSYIGDATIGEGANIGAGTITCNYDGANKFQTIIGPRSFIGSNTQLVAPVKLGADSWVGAGSTITENVPSGALALSRVEQKNIKGWSRKRRKKKRKIKSRA